MFLGVRGSMVGIFGIAMPGLGVIEFSNFGCRTPGCDQFFKFLEFNLNFWSLGCFPVFVWDFLFFFGWVTVKNIDGCDVKTP